MVTAAALRHVWLRRLAGRVLAAFPGLRGAALRLAFPPTPIAQAGMAEGLAEDKAAATLGPCARLVHRRLRAAVARHEA